MLRERTAALAARTGLLVREEGGACVRERVGARHKCRPCRHRAKKRSSKTHCTNGLEVGNTIKSGKK